MSGQRCYHCLDQIQWENDLNRNRVKEYLIFYTYEFVFHWDQIVLASHYRSANLILIVISDRIGSQLPNLKQLKTSTYLWQDFNWQLTSGLNSQTDCYWVFRIFWRVIKSTSLWFAHFVIYAVLCISACACFKNRKREETFDVIEKGNLL